MPRKQLVKTIPALGALIPDIGSRPTHDQFIVIDSFTGKVKTSIDVEVADTALKRRNGLSHRESMGDNEGMLFPAAGSFWMKDVNFPLDLAFMDDDFRITEILHMKVDKSGSRIYNSTSDESACAIELPGGFCKKHGIGVGDRVLPVSENTNE